MKKNEYVAPEMEIVEITEQYGILLGDSNETPGQGGFEEIPDGPIGGGD